MAYRARVDYNRKFGVEMEAVGKSVDQTLNLIYDLQDAGLKVEYSTDFIKEPTLWCLSKDSTVIGDEPIELSTPAMSLGNGGFFELEVALRSLCRRGFTVNDSCGLHIHWDVSDFTGSQILNILKFYAKFEPVIDYLVAENRRKNNNKHCQTLIKNGGSDWVDTLILDPLESQPFHVANRFQRTQKLDGVDSFPSARHHKVNITSINKYHTVEFRQHQGTLDGTEIYFWILLTQQIVSRAKELSVRTGEVSWKSLVKTLGLNWSQLDGVFEENRELERLRRYYKRIYKENINGVSKRKSNVT